MQFKTHTNTHTGIERKMRRRVGESRATENGEQVEDKREK